MRHPCEHPPVTFVIEVSKHEANSQGPASWTFSSQNSFDESAFGSVEEGEFAATLFED